MTSAIVGGLLSGIVVLLGVLFEAKLTQRRERQTRIEETTRRLLIGTRKLEHLSRQPPDGVDRDRLHELDDRVEALALELRLLSLKWRHYRGLTRAIDDLIVNQAVARERRSGGIPMSLVESLGASAIGDLVFPDTTDVGERVHDSAMSTRVLPRPRRPRHQTGSESGSAPTPIEQSA
jgi:hypothetical protein